MKDEKDKPLRAQLKKLLGWKDAHAGFDAAVEGVGPPHQGTAPPGLPFSPWQLLEHLRICQSDILDFCRNPAYKERVWPKDYWPSSPKPPPRPLGRRASPRFAVTARHCKSWRRMTRSISSPAFRMARDRPIFARSCSWPTTTPITWGSWSWCAAGWASGRIARPPGWTRPSRIADNPRHGRIPGSQRLERDAPARPPHGGRRHGVPGTGTRTARVAAGPGRDESGAPGSAPDGASGPRGHVRGFPARRLPERNGEHPSALLGLGHRHRDSLRRARGPARLHDESEHRGRGPGSELRRASDVELAQGDARLPLRLERPPGHRGLDGELRGARGREERQGRDRRRAGGRRRGSKANDALCLDRDAQLGAEGGLAPGAGKVRAP